ncbi:MAG: DNA topoisomerase I [Planctomycetaceae bacterium]
MGGVFRALMNLPLFRSVLRPITRVIVGLIAIPVFRFILRRLFRLQDLDEELEKDLEEWFRGALLLLAASANMEHLLFGWMEQVDWLERADWFTMGLRLMLAIGVIEAMPDQELFAVIHPGPPKIKPGKSVVKEFWRKKRAFLKGFVCQHLNRSSPVLAMMAAIVGAQLPALVDTSDEIIHHATASAWSTVLPMASVTPIPTVMAHEVIAEYEPEIIKLQQDYQQHWERWVVGWLCYLLAITQYLIIGLVTSRDRAMDVLSEFDRAVARRRRELIAEFSLDAVAGAGDRSAELAEPESSSGTKSAGDHSHSDDDTREPPAN